MKRERGRRSAAESSSTAPGSGRRAERVAGEIQRVLGELLLHSMRDPRLQSVTITHIKMSPDLRQTYIRFTLLDAEGGDREGAQRALEHAVPFFRRHIAEQLELRYTPDLQFAYDSQLEGARRIDSLLRGIRADRDEKE